MAAGPPATRGDDRGYPPDAMNDRRGHTRAPFVALPLLLVAGLLAACGTPAPTTAPLSTSGPTTGPLTAPPATVPPASEAPTAPATTAAGAPACTPADLKATHGLVEGAAGSRITEVVLVSAIACSIDSFPTLGLRDGSGAAIVGGVAGGPGTIDLSPDAAYTSNVRIGNWCAPEPAFPLALEIRLGAETLAVTGSSFPLEGDLPPCNGDGGPLLEGEAWTPGS